MVVQKIVSYLGSYKRLVVPQLGAFIVKSPGEAVVFSELLRHDDGVLRGLLCSAGMSELESAGAIDRFVFEVRFAVESGGHYLLPGLGEMRGGANGTILFTYRPSVQSSSHTQVNQQPLRPELKISPSVKLNPDPSIKGLRYGRPDKLASGPYRSAGNYRRGFDKLMLVAMVAVVIALATIAYIYIRDSRSEADGYEQIFVEQESAVSSEQPPISK